MDRWQTLVAAFEMDYLPGMVPWDAVGLEKSFPGATHDEQCTIRFLLNLWDHTSERSCGPFNLFAAYDTWDDIRRNAFLSWGNDPFWP